VISPAAAGAGPVIISVDEANPPFMFADPETGEASGLYPVLIRAVFARAEIPVEIKAYPWKRALSYGESGETGVGGIYKNENRVQVFDYSDPIFAEKLVLYVRRDFPLDFKGLASLKGKRIGVIRGWSYGSDFDRMRSERAFVADEASSDAFNFQKLAIRREIDCVIATDVSGDPALERLGLSGAIVKEKIPLAILDVYIVFSNKSPDKKIIPIFNRTLAKMKSDGSYGAVVRNFFLKHSPGTGSVK
jgi:polar amino acid transport system substrate-binding protein